MAIQTTPNDVHGHDEERLAQWLPLDPRGDRPFRILTSWYWDLVYRLRAYGAEHVPAEGPFLLVPNHSSYTDPFLQVRPQPRTVRFMAKGSLFEYPVVRRIMKAGGAFPVQRGRGDAFAIELSRRILADGQPLVVYPEGTRFRRSLELGPPKRGAARLALEARVPVVPAATWGVKARELYGRPRWRRPRATVVYGEPMDFTHLEPTPENVDLVRDEIWAKVTELYERARQLDAER
ncbi:MAG: 1-acyl-sn-glycerol-3-phosphate acyltransferase [Thermoleophilia bacterium]|nr:1-acyl-sn-glycerol-3-phosphate acyltransferase [Thermoleophilia bacterium]